MPDVADARLLTLVEMAMYDWLDARPAFKDPLLVTVFSAGFDAGAGSLINLITTRKWDPYAHR